MDSTSHCESDELRAAKTEISSLILEAQLEPQSVVQNSLQNLDRIRAIVTVADQELAGWEVAKMRLRKAGVPVKDIQALDRVINRKRKRERGVQSEKEPEEGIAVPVLQVLPDAPVDWRFMVPEGWILSEQGLFTGGGENVTRSPILISRRHLDADTGVEFLTVQWRKGKVWHERIIERVEAARTSDLVNLARFGLQINSGSGSKVVTFLGDFEAANLEVLPVSMVSQRLGWLNGGSGFLCGHNYLGSGGDPAVRFVPQDIGDEQLADAITAAGSFQEWKEAAAIGARYPKVRLSLYVAFVPPLLEIVRSPNFVLDLAGVTSSGKTTTLRLCASCWGNPDERSSNSYLRSWNVTRVFCERATAIFNGLPIILDDTKTVSDEKLGVSIIYDLVAGIGRGRGSIKGLCQTSSWRSVLISSGENPVTAFSRDGGTRARTLSLWGSPFGQRDEATAKVVQEMDQAIKKNFGHAGPKFVEYLIENRDQWDEYRQAFQNLQDGYLERAAGDPVAGRMAAYFAVITLAAQLAHEALDLPWLYEDPVLPLWDELTAGTDEADPPKKALEHVQAWAIGHERSFYGRHDSDSLGRARSPAGGWAGRWDSRDDWQHIDFVRPRLDLLLGQAGFDPEAVRRSWMERGWLARDGDGKGTITARIGKQLLRLVRVKRAAWEELYVPEGVTYQNAQFLV